jgi:hypothetical protein
MNLERDHPQEKVMWRGKCGKRLINSNIVRRYPNRLPGITRVRFPRHTNQTGTRPESSQGHSRGRTSLRDSIRPDSSGRPPPASRPTYTHAQAIAHTLSVWSIAAHAAHLMTGFCIQTLCIKSGNRQYATPSSPTYTRPQVMTRLPL